MIKILGAGIAGLTAAINLAKAGEEVVIYEKLANIGAKLKPNTQLLGNWETKEEILTYLKKFNVDVNYKTRIKDVILYPPNLKRKAEIIGDTRPVGYVVVRGGKDSFENYLAEKAKREGVRIITGFKEKVDAKVIATGAMRVEAIIWGGVFEGSFNKGLAEVFFNYRYAPTGYIYLLPHSKKIATLALGIRPWQGNVKSFFEKAISKHPLIKERISGARLLHNFSGFINFRIPKSAIEGDSLLVGEAAGFQDESFGFGMRYAVLSGYLAAKSILENKNYDQLWKKAFLHELRKTHRLRVILDRVGNWYLNRLISHIGKRSIDKFQSIWCSGVKVMGCALLSFLF